jgi:replicative DNA helicase
MSYTQIITRLALALGKVSFVKHVTGKLSDADKDRFRDAAGEIGKLPIFIRDGVFSMLDVAAETRRYVDRGARLVVVDYIQRVQPLDRRGQTREQEIADISRRLKDLAQVHQLPVIALSQVNEDNRARESRAIEHDMDKMLLLVREDGQAVADVKVRQRMGSSGGLGDIKLQYETDFGLWRDYAVSREIMPVTGPAGRDDDQLAF